MLKRITSLIFPILLLILTTSCAHNAANHVPDFLVTEDQNYSNETAPIDLTVDAQCPGARPIQIINKETRTEQYVYGNNLGHEFYIIPEQFNEYIVKYMEENLVESGLTIDKETGREIHVAIEEVKEVTNAFNFWASIKLKITIPDIEYTKIYFGENGSGHAYKAVSYAIHLAVMKFIEDPIVQNYIRCQN